MTKQQFMDTVAPHLENVKIGSNYVTFSSPFRVDRNPSCVFYPSTNKVIDFGRSSSTVSLGEFLTDLYNETGVHIAYVGESILHVGVTINGKRERVVDELEIVGDIQDALDNIPVTAYLRNTRFFTDDTIRKYKIFTPKHKVIINGSMQFFTKDFFIPIYSKGKMVSVECRTFVPRTPKVLYPKNNPVNSMVFNQDKLNKDVKRVFVFEGIMDCIYFEQVFPNEVCVATFGAKITEVQMDILAPFSCYTVPDSGDAGEDFVKKLQARLSYLKVFNLPPHVKDVNSCTEGELKNYLKACKPKELFHGIQAI